MLNKNEMQKFASQFVTGKIKTKKNEHIYGKSDSYYVTKNELFIQFQENSIIVRLSNVGSFLDSMLDVRPTLRNYINNVNKIIEIENKNRNTPWPTQLEGPINTEISFNIKKKKPILSKFTLTVYPHIRCIPTDFGGMIIDLPLHYNNELLIVNFESNEKVVHSDFRVLKLPFINEIVDFNDILDELFIKQLKTLEMALL